MPGFIPKIPLHLQILIINFFGLVFSTLSWFKWGQRLKKTWGLSALQFDEPHMKEIDWIRTTVSRIDVARSVINRVSLFACLANIYTTLTQNRQNLLVLSMVLSFMKDIALEVIIIVIILLLWLEGHVSTSLLVKFVVEKTIWLVFPTWKWYATLQWYAHLRRVTRIREFMLTARRRTTVEVNDTSGRAGRSLDDECLSVAALRRREFANSLDDFPDVTSSDMNFDRRTSKFLTTLITSDSYESNGANDYDSIANDLSVDEKSMKLLSITAEDVMDARARIQERSYWGEQGAIARTFDLTEDAKADFSPGKDAEKTTEEKEKADASGNGQIATSNAEGAAYPTSRREDAKNPPAEEERDNSEGVSPERTKSVTDVRGEALNISPAKEDAGVALDKAEDPVRSAEFRDSYAASEERTERAQEVAKITRCLSDGRERSTEIKPRPSLVKEAEMKLHCVSHEDRRVDEVEDQMKHLYGVRPQLAPTAASNVAHAKGYYKRSKMSSYACRYGSCVPHANVNTQKSVEGARPANINNKNVKRDIDGDELRRFAPKVVARGNTLDGHSYALKHLARCSEKPSQVSRGSLKKQSVAWNSMSLAQTARPSGYARKFAATGGSSNRREGTEKIPTANFDGSRDSLRARRGLTYVGRVQHRQSIDPRALCDAALFDKKRSAGSVERETSDTRALSALLAEKRRAKAKTRLGDLPPSRKLSIEEREAIELRALRAYNERTLLEDKRELEARRRYDSSLSHERSTKAPKVPKVRAPRAHKDLASPEDKAEIETSRDDSPVSCEQPIKELNAPSTHSKFTFSDNEKGELGRGHHSMRDKDVEAATSAFDRPAEEEAAASIHSSVRRLGASGASDSSDHDANLAHMSLNLREITRNIEWTLHPRGIVLINKNLHSQLPESERQRESQQRDIVDGTTASALHNAFFCKPEIVMNIFQHSQARLDESLANFQSLWREDFNTDFNVELIWRVSDEVSARDRASSLDFVFERSTRNDRSSLGSSLPFNVERRSAEEDNSRICIIFFDREEAPSDSESTIAADSLAAESQGNIGNVRTTNILMLDENNRCVDSSVTTDNPAIQFLIDMLRNFAVEETSQGNTTVADSDVAFRELNASGMIYGLRDNNNRDKASSPQMAHLDDTTDDRTEEISNWSNSLDHVDVASPVNECDNRCSSRDEEYSDASNIGFGKICESNLPLENADKNVTSNTNDSYDREDSSQFDKIANETERSTSDHTFRNSSEIFFPCLSSFDESRDRHVASKSRDEGAQKLERLSDDRVAPDIEEEEERGKAAGGSISSLRTDNDEISLSEVRSTKAIFRSESTARNEDEGGRALEGANEPSTDRSSRMNSGEKLREDNSFDSTYERNDSSETPISLEEGSLMEEFSHDSTPPEISSDASAISSSHAQ